MSGSTDSVNPMYSYAGSHSFSFVVKDSTGKEVTAKCPTVNVSTSSGSGGTDGS